MRRALLGLLIGLLCVMGCGVPQNYAPKLTKLETPMGVREVGLGDQLLVEGDLKEHIILTVKEPIRVNMCYTFTSGEYEKTGEAGKYEFYNERPLKGKVKINFPCDPTQGVRYSEQDQKICAITIYGIASCASAPPDNVTRSTLKTGSFIRELLFTGYIDSKLRVTYREFVESTRQPALVVEIEHEISQLPTLVEYKGARLEILAVTNRQIQYQVLQGFMQRSAGSSLLQ
jgi:hypothetical protein